jgi:hypothetical protein
MKEIRGANPVAALAKALKTKLSKEKTGRTVFRKIYSIAASARQTHQGRTTS